MGLRSQKQAVFGPIFFWVLERLISVSGVGVKRPIGIGELVADLVEELDLLIRSAALAESSRPFYRVIARLVVAGLGMADIFHVLGVAKSQFADFAVRDPQGFGGLLQKRRDFALLIKPGV